MGHRSREEVFAWAAAETAADRRPSYRDMARWGTDWTLEKPLSKSTVSTWVARHGDPRILDDPSDDDSRQGGAQTTEHPPEHPCVPPQHNPQDSPTPSASSGVRTTDRDTSGHFSGLSPQQEQAVFLKAQGQSHTAIAEAVGVSRSTVVNWLRLPAFAAALSELRAEAHVVSREALLAGAQESVEATREIQRVMLAVVRGDAVALSPEDLRLREAGEKFNVILDPRLQIQAARVLLQAARALMDRGGFHPKAELHLAGEGEGGGEDFSVVPLGVLENELEEELAELRADEQYLRLLEGVE